MPSTDQNETGRNATRYFDDIGRFLDDKSKTVKDDNDADNWYSKCTRKIHDEWVKDNATSREGIAEGLIMDINGKRLLESNENNIDDTWGISVSVCKDYCSRDRLNMATNFNRIAAGSTSYLLPWLALTAQLPYETGSTGFDVLSVCVGLGSPMLMTISLMITILNKTWIRKAFKKCRDQDDRQGQWSEIAKATVIIAEAAQQTPTRLTRTEQSRQIFLDGQEHGQWWKEAGNYLKSARRGITLSLVAQLSVAIIAWILTAVGSLTTKVGDTEEALVLSSGSLWIWLVPVIMGWILVGTQNKAGTMQPALNNGSSSDGYRPGIEVADGPLPSPSSVPPNRQNPVNRSRDKLWIFRIAGFQRQEGPAFNYARTLTWISFANNLLIAFKAATRPQELDQAGPQQPAGSDADLHESESHGSQTHLAQTNNANHSLRQLNGHLHQPEYSNLNELGDAEPIFWKNIAISILMGILIQWGTTILAFILAFQTVVKGLGCRSGSYLIYGILSTAACSSLLFSAALSHITMRAYERSLNDPGLRTRVYGALAVFTRLLGCVLLVTNTIWLLLISIWELIGFFDSCYCASTELSKKEAGWILLFKGTDVLKEDAQEAWGVGIGLGFVLIFMAIAIFYLGSRHK